MNFLALVNDAMTECGTGQTTPLATLVAPPNQEVSRFITWVGDAWTEMQIANPRWEFLRTTVDFQTTTQIGDYSLATINAQIWANNQFTTGTVQANCGIADYIPKTFRCWTIANELSPSPAPGGTPGDEQIMNFMPWDTFRNIYRYATMRTTYSRPVIVTIDPLKGLRFGPIPDQPYNIQFEIEQLPQILILDTDVPMAPIRFHKAITYAVMQKYAAFESAPEVMQRGMVGYNEIMDELEFDRLPIIHAGPPLA